YFGSYTVPFDTCLVTVTASGRDICGGNLVANLASCPVATTPLLAVTQNCPVAPVRPGSLFTYSGTVSNAGNITLTNVVILNSLSGATPIFTTAVLDPGASANFTGSYIAPATGPTTSTSTASATSLCGAPVTNTASSTCAIVVTPAIAAAMSNGAFNLSFPSTSGQSYTVQYKNTLNDPTWTDLETVVGTGGNLPITDPAAAKRPTRFYRVMPTQ
ncbi:MAG: DUF7507 domain-containing protein, partial [Limisphaerales bacterium]